MTNGSTIDSIEAILTGDEPLPEKVTNRLLLSAIRVNYQKNQEIESKYNELVKCWRDCQEDIDNLDTAIKVQMQRTDQIEKTSSRWDKILAVMTVAGTSIGAMFGQK